MVGTRKGFGRACQKILTYISNDLFYLRHTKSFVFFFFFFQIPNQVSNFLKFPPLLFSPISSSDPHIMEEVEEEVKRIVEQVKELHDSSTSFVSSSSQEELSLRKRASLVDASIHRLHSTLVSDKHLDPKLFEKVKSFFEPISPFPYS